MYYIVEVSIEEYKDIEIEAKDADEAHDKAQEMLENGNIVFDNPEYSAVSIHTVSKSKEKSLK